MYVGFASREIIFYWIMENNLINSNHRSIKKRTIKYSRLIFSYHALLVCVYSFHSPFTRQDEVVNPRLVYIRHKTTSIYFDSYPVPLEMNTQTS